MCHKYTKEKADKMRVGIIGIGHPFESQYMALKALGYEVVVCDKDENKLKNIDGEKYIDYYELVDKVDYVFISTPPETHYEIIKYFVNKNIKVICEKPMVITKNQLDDIKNYCNEIYNILHFSWGEEIEWFINNYNSKDIKDIKEIKAYINDPYIVNEYIRDESLSLNGAYLDETVNPLSAIVKIVNGDIKFRDVQKKYYDGDIYDYEALSNFKINNIDVSIDVKWNDNGLKEKYIDIYYQDTIIRLDSFNVQVVNLNTKEVLFKSNNHRMNMHYLNALKNISFDEWDNVVLLYEALLEGVDV